MLLGFTQHEARPQPGSLLPGRVIQPAIDHRRLCHGHGVGPADRALSIRVPRGQADRGSEQQWDNCLDPHGVVSWRRNGQALRLREVDR